MTFIDKDLENEVFLKLKEIITEIIGEDAVEIVGITRSSVFAADLMIDSIQFVALAEYMKAYYGNRINFVGWLSRKSIRQIIGITVGDVSAFIAGELSSFRPANKHRQTNYGRSWGE